MDHALDLTSLENAIIALEGSLSLVGDVPWLNAQCSIRHHAQYTYIPRHSAF